jgi:hypothetical protein
VVLAARGLSNRLIARELRISEATVKRHTANIYPKIGVRSRNEAVRTALEEQWIGLHEITSSPADGDGSPDGQGARAPTGTTRLPSYSPNLVEGLFPEVRPYSIS